MSKLFLLVCILTIFTSCKSRTEEQNPLKSKQLYSEGMKILDSRISIQSSDSSAAMELNKKAIEKFTASYKADSSFVDALLMTSECTMYEKDYKKCEYWTAKLLKLDTSKHNVIFCTERIDYCKQQIRP